MSSLLLPKLDAARKELLDFTGRNRLTNYSRPTQRRGGIAIIDEMPEQVFRHLVQQGKPMNFLPAVEEVAEQSTLLQLNPPLSYRYQKHHNRMSWQSDTSTPNCRPR